MVKASLLFYSKLDKFIPHHASIGKGMPFITTALGSTNDKDEHDHLTYIWRIVRGPYPAVAGMSDNGAVVYFTAPDKPDEDIEIELRVNDILTTHSDTATIVIHVLNV